MSIGCFFLVALERTFCNVLLNALYLGLAEEGTLCVIWVVYGKMGVGN